MTIELMKLPFAENALEPTLSKEQVKLHYHKHHKAYVDKLNKLIKDTEFEKLGVEQIMAKSESGPIFNNSAQIYNHDFYWKSLSPNSKFDTNSKLGKKIISQFGSLDAFKKEANEKVKKFFGSGWLFLTSRDGKLVLSTFRDAHNPLSKKEGKPLLTIDIWEHSFYVSYPADRGKYMEEIWNVVNWDFAEKNF